MLFDSSPSPTPSPFGIHAFGPPVHAPINTLPVVPPDSEPQAHGSLPAYLAQPSPSPSFVPHQGQRAHAGLLSEDHHVNNVIQHLLSALGQVRDPHLRESLSNALAVVNKHVAARQKEAHLALAGKLSPRLLAEAQAARQGETPQVVNPGGELQFAPGSAGPARLLAAQGNYAEAANQWIARHPFAVSHGQIPGFVSQWINEAQVPAAYSNAPAGAVSAQ